MSIIGTSSPNASRARHVSSLGFGDTEVRLFGAGVDDVDRGVGRWRHSLPADEEPICVADRHVFWFMVCLLARLFVPLG
jgi:hypothetical protein